MEKYMNIAVIGGSPKGEISVTMQYVKYMEESFPEYNFKHLQASQEIKAILKDSTKEKHFFETIGQADIILWAFPLYYLLVHGNYKRFIELCYKKYKQIFSGKYAASLSTSIHFYDHTAHNYIQAVSEDLGMQFITAFSPKMDDLLSKEGQYQTKQFTKQLISAVENKLTFPKHYPEQKINKFIYQPEARLMKYKSERKIVIVQDRSYSEESNIGKMIKQFKDSIDGIVKSVILSEIKITGGCMGCLKCGPDNICVYEGKDEFIEMFRENIMNADILVWAGEMEDRYLSWQWKQFFDRSFFNTHQPVLKEKQVLFLISGPLAQNSNFREILISYVEFQEANLINIISDDNCNSTELDSNIQSAAVLGIDFAERKYNKTRTFRAVSGMKIFRDDIFEGLKVVFKGDHRTYRKRKYYDYKGFGILHRAKINIAYALTSIPFIKKQMYSNMPKMMISQFQKVLAKNK
jgi:multimeric flavodoxin WrbA